MKVLVTGATGFVGRVVAARLLDRGHRVVAMSRDPSRAKTVLSAAFGPQVSEMEFVGFGEVLPEVEGVINLAGESIANRWTEENRKKIYDSRVVETKKLISRLKGIDLKVFVNASAIGFYGDREDDWLKEDSSQGRGGGFLPKVCHDWEATLSELPSTVRAAALRIGLVIGRGGGALDKMVPIFRLGMGATLGDGKQWMSWIHVEDLAALFVFVLETDSMSGVFNAVAPEPVRNRTFTEVLGAVLGRPVLFKVPRFVLETALGEMSTVLLSSQRVSSEKVRGSGFQFKYSKIADALAEVLGA